MLDKLSDFLDSRGVSTRDFITVVIAMGFLTSMVGILLYCAICALMM